MRDPEKARARTARHRQKQKVEKFGPAAAGVDMRGRHTNHARGPANPRWNDGRILNEDGYVKVRVGVAHPLADSNGYAYEHLVVWCAAGNPKPSDNETLHHRNGIKSDNRIQNLELMPRSEHGRQHAEMRDRAIDGRFTRELI